MVPIGWPSQPQLGLISQTSHILRQLRKGNVHSTQCLRTRCQSFLSIITPAIPSWNVSQLGSSVLSTIVAPTRMFVLSSHLHLWLLKSYTQLKSIGYPLLKKIAFLRKLRPLSKVKSYVSLVLCYPSTQSLTHLALYVWVAETVSRRCHTQVRILSSSLENILWLSWWFILNIFAYFMLVLHH